MAKDNSAIRGDAKPDRPLLGLLIAQALGSFNDNAWKQIVVLLAVVGAGNESQGQARAAQAQALLITTLMLVSLPAGVMADRISKRTVIVAMKMLEVVLMSAAIAVLWAVPSGGVPALVILGLLGIQAGIFSPAKYGLLPEILPHERLAFGNGLLELWNNLAILMGTAAGGVIVKLAEARPWMGAVPLAVFSAIGLATALGVPRVSPARTEGGLAVSVRLAWEAINADRILRLAIRGQLLVWAVGCLVPPPVLSYASKTLHLDALHANTPLAVLGLGVGLGSLVAGKLSSPKVEYGLLPLGALGLSISTLAFALIGPGAVGTIVMMGLIGVFSGLLFVPLNALVQWRAPADRRGAVIALANVLVYAGMLAGSLTALGLAQAGISARGTFLVAGVALAGGFVWAFSLVPDSFLRFMLILLAHTLYRVRVLGRQYVPEKGGALLTPNHVSFVDGLFVIAGIDRPVRFVVYSRYFQWPLFGWFLRSMRTIPISGSGGPKMILQAFREAGRALDAGELVCIFPEGQVTRTGLLVPFARGLERIVKGRTVPIIPVHIDRATASVFSPVQGPHLPERFPVPITVSFGLPQPTDTPLYAIRDAIRDLERDAWKYRKDDSRPLHREFIRRARRRPLRLALADERTPQVSRIGTLAGGVALARAFGPRWQEQPRVGILLPPSAAGAIVNLAAALAGRAAVNLNHTMGSSGLRAALRQAALRTVVTSRLFVERAKLSLDLPEGVELLWLEDIEARLTRRARAVALGLAAFAPAGLLERACGASRRVTVDDTVAVIFSSGSTGEPKGVVLSHLNILANVEAIFQIFRARRDDRIVDVLPLFHSFGYMLLWLGMARGLALVCYANPLEAGTIGDLVPRYRATVLLATPTLLRLYHRHCAPAQFGSLRLILAGAEKLPEAFALAFEDDFGIRLLEGYGMTECAPVVAVSTLDFRGPGFFQPGARRGYVGQPLPGVAVRIVDPERFEPLPPGAEGLILVNGPNVMAGYLGRDDLTAAAFHDGWYVTGDMGLRDEDDFLKITGRLARFSKIGGEMVPHERVEEALQQAVDAEDREFAVTAVHDAHKGEQLAVLHTVSPDRLETAISRLPALGLPSLFIPHRDHFVKVDALPVLGTGKLDLREARRMAEKALGVGNVDGQARR
jgi:acyl-[acyl-carrier-protein]-phospholipid O-acyltransferase/long-chain-fatty-acid--[acyl-carrier-protein] ligase